MLVEKYKIFDILKQTKIRSKYKKLINLMWLLVTYTVTNNLQTKDIYEHMFAI